MPRPKEKFIDPRAQQIYNLKALSRQHRDRFYGAQWFDIARQLFEVGGGTFGSAGAYPSWKPPLSIPQLQTLLMAEATDLASINPRVLISGRDLSNRDKERERAFRDHWRMIGVPQTLLMAELWSLFSGTGWIWSGTDPSAMGGNGLVWCSSLDPENVFPDPFARFNPIQGCLNWQFVIVEAFTNLDEIKARFAPRGKGPAADLNIQRVTAGAAGIVPQVGQNPPFPTATLFGPSTPPDASIADPSQSRNNNIPVNYCFTYDYTETKGEAEEIQELGETGIHMPKSNLVYPWGRMLLECDGRILFDDANPWGGLGGKTMFPVIPVWAMPPLTGPWSYPPPRLSLGIQELAGRMYSQLYENMYRTNNATWFIEESTQIDARDFGALPAEIVMHATGSKVPTPVWPSPMPAHMMEGPERLMEWQRTLQGFTPERMGEAGDGNISPDLFEAGIGEAKKMTQMRAMLLQTSIQNLSELLYYQMERSYKTSRIFPSFNPSMDSGSGEEDGKVDETSTWEKPGEEGSNIYVHPSSIEIRSQGAWRKYILGLRQAGMLSVKRALEEMEFPNYEDVASEIDNENALAALAKVKKSK